MLRLLNSNGVFKMVKKWDYYLENLNGEIVKWLVNIPSNEAPQGAEYNSDGEIMGYWHPALP